MKDNKKKQLLMLTYGDWYHSSSRIRAAYYTTYLDAEGGWEVHWLPRAPRRGKGLINRFKFALIKRIFGFRQVVNILFRNWDVIFVQRQFLATYLLNAISRRKIPLIFDFDDAIYLGNSRNEELTKQMLFSASAIIVSSPELAGYCELFGLNTEIIPSPVDSKKIIMRNHNQTGQQEVVLGWIGSDWTEKYLKNIEDVLIQVNKEQKIKLLVIGASKSYTMDGVSLEVLPWSFNEENEMLHKMDIGLMPLPNDEWSKGKGGYKLYQYMAAGLPVVASPVGINKKIVEHGVTGYLADSTQEWIDYLIALIQNKGLQKKMGEKGREKLVSNYSYEVCYPQLESILSKVTQ